MNDNLVYTTMGLVPREKLTVIDEVKEDQNSRQVVTKWFYGEALVRQDAWVNFKRGFESTIEGDLNG